MAKGKTPGYWRKRGGDSYYLEVCIGTDFTGAPNRYSKTVHCKSDKEADRELSKFYAACEAGDVSKPDKTTVEAFYAKWIEEQIRQNRRKTTYVAYKSRVSQHAIPYFGTRPITKIRPIDIRQWVNHIQSENGKRGKPLSARTVKEIHAALSSMFETAIDWEYIKDNPCRRATPKPPKKTEAKFYNKEQVFRLLSEVSTIRDEEFKFKVAIMLVLFSGVRLGELMGLVWDGSILFDKGCIRIFQERIYRKEFGTYTDEPKTDNGYRTIDIPAEIMGMLTELRQRQRIEKIRLGSKWIDSGFIFVNTFGKGMAPSSMQNWFQKFIKERSLDPITLHQLRHTYTSILAYLDVKDIEISKQLGHANPVITNMIYKHLFERTGRRISEDISAEFLTKNLTKK
jgi:integrase